MRFILALALALVLGAIAPAGAQDGPVQALLQSHADDIAKPSRRTIQPVLDDLAGSGLAQMPEFLEAWADKGVVRHEADGLFFFGRRDGDAYVLRSVEDGAEVGRIGRRDVAQLKPNAGVRKLIASALVQFQLGDPDPDRRRAALDAIARNPGAEMLAPLRASIADEPDRAIRLRKEALDRVITIRHGTDRAARLAAVLWMADQVSIEARAALNGVLTTDRVVGAAPDGANVARRLQVGADIPEAEAERLMIEAGALPPAIGRDARDAALVAAIQPDEPQPGTTSDLAEAEPRGGTVAGIPVAELDDEQARWDAYDALGRLGVVPARPGPAARDAIVAGAQVFDVYREPDPAITDAAAAALAQVEARVARAQVADLGLDALSLASIYFLAAVGLAITFGVMGVINMAHGEFIMIGAYTGYVVQQVVPDKTLSLVVALPLAFLAAGAAGVALERSVIRHLAHRPLETLLATFGISVALQQVFKNVFGTQAVPLTPPDWLAGAWVLNDVVGISYVRIAIFVMAAIFLAALVWTLRRTRLGLEVRAVTQNPGMAASLGIDPDRVGMATFGLGSGIAGVAGLAIGLFAQVTSEMGSGYIVQSFMTVVVGGVGSVLGTLAGAGLIGGLQKGIEWLNPSNTLAAQTYMILFIILFIQIRPRGIVALKGRQP